MEKFEYDAFISYSHQDNAFSDRLYDLLTKAGFKVWYDKICFPSNAHIRRDLSKYIEQCKSLILIISKNSYKSEWVTNEYSFAMSEGINIIPVKIDECDTKGFLNNYKWIDCPNGLNYDVFFQIIQALYNIKGQLSVDNDTDVYLACPWRESEKSFRDIFVSILKNKGLRLIGDSQDQPSYNEGERVEELMRSCRGFVAIVPYRASKNTSPYIIDEINKAKTQELPSLLISDRRVQGLEQFGDYICWYDNGDFNENELNDEIDDFIDLLKQPQEPRYVFYATELGADRKHLNSVIGRLINLAARIPVVFGENVTGENLQKQLVERICNAFLVISDISQRQDETGKIHINTLIEAGIARGAGRKLFLVSKGKRTTPPFMFRDMEVAYYEDECDLLAFIHKTMLPYRRRVLNDEL